ncbi:MAG: hypothetical protein HDS16_00625 [Bacteroides sp.]|nr:hypothetical protein [Bacteroides sp.]
MLFEIRTRNFSLAIVGTWRAMSELCDCVKCGVYPDVARHVPTLVR